MRVGELLGLEALDLRLLSGDAGQLAREITGVTATDLEDPSRFLQRGELVLSGLVWWSAEEGHRKVDRFVEALRTTGAAALLAGEETHGEVPGQLVGACRTHRIALLSVPAHITFRTITDAVYLRRWGDLNRQPDSTRALPDNVRGQLSALLARQASVTELLACAFSHLGGAAAYVVTASGRTLAATPDAPAPEPSAVRAAAARTPAAMVPLDPSASPYDAPSLFLPDPGMAPPRVLHEIADVLAQRLASARIGAAARRQAGGRLAALVARTAAEPAAVAAALAACGLPTDGPALVVTARVAAPAAPAGQSAVGERDEWAAAALREALHSVGAGQFAVGVVGAAGAAGGEEAVAVVAGESSADPAGLTDRLREIWPVLGALAPRTPLHGGAGLAATADPQALRAGLTTARYARTSEASAHPDRSGLRTADDLGTLGDLLDGIPAEVRAAFHERVLGALTAQDSKTHGTLITTLETFLAHDGSWSRSAEVLHVHVNTVHYRLQRIEQLTGRDLSRLADRLDLRTALLCRPDARERPLPGPVDMNVRRLHAGRRLDAHHEPEVLDRLPRHQ